MPRVIRAYVRIVDRMSDWVGYLAAGLIFVMGATMLFDAFARNVINLPVHWPMEFTQFTLVAYYFMGGAITLKNNSHVRMDLLYANFSDRKKAGIDLVTVFCLIFYLVIMLIGAISSLTYAIETGERRNTLWNPSTIPIKTLLTACLVLMLMQAVSLVFKHIATLRGEQL